MHSKTILLIVLSSLLLAFSASAQSLPERIDKFVELLEEAQPIDSYDIRNMQSEYRSKLLDPVSMLPQTANYPLEDIQRLYSLAQTCTGKLPLSPLITEPLVFTRAICKNTDLNINWFARSALIHPGGGTYAYRYSQIKPSSTEALQPFMHIKERPVANETSLLGRLQRMEQSSMSALLAGSSMFVENGELWLRFGDNYKLYAESVWETFAEESGLVATRVNESSSCFVQRGNLCWETENEVNLLRAIIILILIANVIFLIAWFIFRFKEKRQEMKNRMLILQILTHELRTPIASLSLTVEGFRREFEHLPESVYDEFRRLCEDSRRLRQLAEASKDYLQSEHKPLATEWVPSIEEWLSFKLEEEFDNKVKMSINQDVAAKLNVYWLGTCIDNLIRNALKYGEAPVQLDVKTSAGKVRIKVIDQGSLTQKDWKRLSKPFVSKSGLGLGLTIVDSMVGRMGGKMSLIGPPTTFILEIPCETDTTSR